MFYGIKSMSLVWCVASHVEVLIVLAGIVLHAACATLLLAPCALEVEALSLAVRFLIQHLTVGALLAAGATFIELEGQRLLLAVLATHLVRDHRPLEAFLLELGVVDHLLDHDVLGLLLGGAIVQSPPLPCGRCCGDQEAARPLPFFSVHTVG